MEITKSEVSMLHTEMHAFNREIERSRHQTMREIGAIRQQHQFTRKADILVAKAEAMHVLRTSELELVLLTIQDRLSDAALLEGPQPIAATQR